MRNQGDCKYRAYIDETGDDLKVALQRGLEFIDWDKYVSKSSRIFVKPNFTFPHYKEGVTTSPELLKCLLEIFKSKADTIILGESDGGNHSFKAEEAFRGHNMYQICQETGVELVNLSTLPSETVASKILGKTVKVQLPKLLLEEIDCFISVPVLKVHAMTTVTLSLKNSWGCVPDTMRCVQHQDLSHKLALIARFLKPKIVVVDGTYALNKHGPMYGEAVRANLILVADNPVVSDAFGAAVMGFLPKKVRHIAVAEKAGLGSANPLDAQLNKDWQQYKRLFHIEKTFIDRISSIPFRSDAMAKVILDSPLTSPIYMVAGLLRTGEEREVASQMGKQRTLGPY